MAMKYLPTVRDQKAAVRFLNKQKQTPNFKKSSDKPASAKSGKAAEAAKPAEPQTPASA
jgi:hypothetical protein